MPHLSQQEKEMRRNMKVCSIQPPYPYTLDDVVAHQNFILSALAECDDSLDLIVLPECCNAPTSLKDSVVFLDCVRENTPVLLNAVRETAERCNAMVAINLYDGEKPPFRNTTILFDRKGNVCGKYEKQHLPLSEINNPHIDHTYLDHFKPVTIIENEGIRFGFVTCYDCYFDEYIAAISRMHPDIVVMCAYQRGERKDMLETQSKNIAFQTNAYVIRSSVSMGSMDYEYGGQTMVTAPDGKILCSLGQKTGRLVCDIDISFKHSREAGFGQASVPNEEFIARGRTPWCYRAAGPGTVPGDRLQGYPRVCSHRGFNSVLPENTMPAFGMSVALGADEIELDIWPTKDHRLVVCHDAKVDRTSDGHGLISDLTWDEISKLNIGAKYMDQMNGLRYPLFDEVLERFARRTIINLHIKSVGNVAEYDHDDFARILELIYRYDMQEHVYISGVEDVLRTAVAMAPELPRCALDGTLDFTLVDLAKKYKCEKLQLFRSKTTDYFNQKMIDEANEAGIRCNLFWSDDPAEAVDMVRRGVSTILTNDYLRVATAVKSVYPQEWRYEP